jgi:hypothetical protein
MRVTAVRRGACLGILAIVAVVLLALTSTTTAIFALTATTALIMGGSDDPLTTSQDGIPFIQNYMQHAVDGYIAPSLGGTPGSYNTVAVITPEQFAQSSNSTDLTFDKSVAEGVTDLDTCIKTPVHCGYNTDITGSTAPAAGDSFVVFGYSQSATIGTIEKENLAKEYATGEGPAVSFVFIGNGNRPNGGFLARGPEGVTIPFPFMFGGTTFSGPTPTDTQYPTVDIAEQYDVWADVPLNPLNLIAMANWYSSYVHYNYQSDSLTDSDVIDQGTYGDTTYYMIPTPILPLLTPVEDLPVIGSALADTLDAPLRVLVEAGYDRTASPGQPMEWNPLYFPNPIKLAVDFAIAIPTGWDNGLQDIFGTRPFGTTRPGPYGVGGPAVTYADLPDTTTTTQDTTDSSAAASETASATGSTAKPAVVSAGAVAEDASVAAVATTPAKAWKPGDGIKAVAGAIENTVSGQIAEDESAQASATAPLSTVRKPGDGLRAAAGAVAHVLAGDAGGASTPAGRRAAGTSAGTRSEASSSPSTSSPASDTTPKKGDITSKKGDITPKKSDTTSKKKVHHGAG